MLLVCRLLVVICGTLAGLGGGVAQTERRVALVIGNSTYQHSRALPNPRNDAAAIAKLLRDIGFEDVSLKIDVNYRVMRESVHAFAQAARAADVALLYFAGHGLEVAGENYLVPTDAKLERDIDLEYEALTLASVLNAAGGARRLRVVILDACRNNPLGDRIALKAGVTRSVSRGLARIEPAGDVLVAYAAKAGTLAEDGPGKHSPFAEALIEHMPTPGLDVRLMFGKVRDHVLSATRQRQEPFTYGSLTGDVVPLVPGMPLTKAQQVELMFWASVKDSTNPTVLSTYLDRYPNGEFAPIARALIGHYEQQLKLDLAKREEDRKLREAALKAAEAKRLEEERRLREAALAEERRRAQEAKDAEAAKKVEEKQKADALAIAESVQKALAEEAAAREAAKAAEEKRLATAKAAEQATKAAEETIATKREEAKASDPAKLSALPKIEKKASERGDGPESDRRRSRDALVESKKYWPGYSIPTGQTVTTTTPDGRRLTCVGGSKDGIPRRCWWDEGDRRRGKPRSRDALAESKKYWPSYSLPTGQTATTTTPDGRRLTCVGGSKDGIPRRCWWN